MARQPRYERDDGPHYGRYYRDIGKIALPGFLMCTFLSNLCHSAPTSVFEGLLGVTRYSVYNHDTIVYDDMCMHVCMCHCVGVLTRSRCICLVYGGTWESYQPAIPITGCSMVGCSG